MKITIIGAGLGGLAAAYLFAKRGHQVVVLEQRSTLSPKGSALMVRPGASRLLQSWGLGHDFEAVADESPAVLLRDLKSGKIAMRNIAVDSSEYPDWGVSRQVIQEIFYRRAIEAGAKISFDAAVVDVMDSAQEASVRLKNGRSIEADLLIAADGVRSRTRRQILADTNACVDPILADMTFYGIIVPTEDIQQDRNSRELLKDVNLTVWHGRDGFVVGRMQKKTGNWVGLFGVKSESSTQERMWDEDGNIEYVRDLFSDSCLPLEAALNIAQTCDRWKIAEISNLPRWTTKSGRILLLGDSAHAMHPNAAQGFSTIVEDIGVLDYLFRERPEFPIATITNLWQKIRKPRVERIQAYAHWNTRMFLGEQLAPSEDNDKNNIKSLKDVRPDANAKFHSSAFLKWAHDYDAIEEARKQLEQEKSRL